MTLRWIVAGGVVPAVTLAVSLAAMPAASAPVLPTGFVDTQEVGGLSFPIAMDFLPDGRMFVLERFNARIRLVVGGGVAATDPAGVVDSVQINAYERGALGIAVDPGWPTRPYVYTYVTALGDRVRISRFTAAGDLANPAGENVTIDAASRRDLVIAPDVAENHNGGTLRFGPDGMLYAALGDDASYCPAQDSVSLRGVILRMDVRNAPAGPGPAPDPAVLAAAGNPYAQHPDHRARIVWAIGLRNPFRFAIDPLDGTIWVGDVGWNTFEEVDRVSGAGANLGWPWFEGMQPMLTCTGPVPAHLDPVYQYDRTGFTNNDHLASVMGGAVYRRSCSNCGFPAGYDGDFFITDFYEGFIRRLHVGPSGVALAAPVPGQPNANDWGRGYDYVTDWHMGKDGALYYVKFATNGTDGTGEVRRIVSTTPPSAVPAAPARAFELAVPRPSPATRSTVVEFTLVEPAAVTLLVCDVAGRTVRTLARDAVRAAGTQREEWDLRDDGGARVAPGVYLVTFEAGGVRTSRPVVVAR